jgi:hypothetical protein
MRDRERQCVYYEYEGSCLKGREGTFRHSCQTCSSYSALKNGKKAREDTRKQRKERIYRKEEYDYQSLH